MALDNTLSPNGLATRPAPAPWDADPVVTPPAPWEADPIATSEVPAGDNGKSRLRSAAETIGGAIERGVAATVRGFGTMNQALGNAMRGGDNEDAQREIEQLSFSLDNVEKLPDGPAKERLRSDFTSRIDDLLAIGDNMRMSRTLPKAGKAIEDDAATRFQPNPAYQGEFLADTVPQVAGGAVQSVVPFLVNPGAGAAAMFSQTFDNTYEENVRAGADPETAANRALLNGIVSGGLESIGSGIVTAGMKKLLLTRGSGGAVRAVTESTLGEGATGALQETASQVIDEKPLDVREIVKQGALEALGGFMLSGTAAATGKALDAVTKPQSIKAEPWLADPETTALGEEGTPLVNDPLAEVQAPAPAAAAPRTAPPARPPSPAPAPPTATSPGSTTTDPISSAETTPAPTPRQLDPYFQRIRDRQDVAGLGYPDPEIAKMTDADVADVLAEQRRYVGPTDPRTALILDAARRQREELANRKAAEAGQIPADEELVEDEDLTPFAAQPGTEEQRLADEMTAQWQAVGERNPPAVIVIERVEDMPAKWNSSARQAVQSGSIVEAYFLTTRKRDGSLVRRIVLVRDGARQIAERRGIPLEQRVRQLALHEIVHHYGSLGALFRTTAQSRLYRQQMDALLQRARTHAPALLDYLTTPREQGGYGYDLAKPEDRAAAVEEYLARFAENQTTAPGWYAEAIATLRNLLRIAFPGLEWTDNDVRALLIQARRRAEKIGRSTVTRTAETRQVQASNGRVIGPALFSIQAHHGTPHKVDKFSAENGQPVGGDVRMSAQPSQEQAEEAGRTPEKRRKFMESVAASPSVAPISSALESIYQPITNKETVAAANDRINTLGLDRALAEVLATGPQNPPTALTNTMGIELMGRLQALHRYEETAALAEHIAAQATTQGQAIQALSLLARLTPEGIDIYTQRVLQRAVRPDPELARMAEIIRTLKEQLRNARYRAGTQAILDLAKIIDDSTKLTPAEKTALMRKLREALLELGQGNEAAALAKLTQLGINAGMSRDVAVRMAKQAVAAFKRAQQASRKTVLRAMLQRAIAEGTRGKVPKTALEKWLAMNEEGMLDDETMFAGIAKRMGLPVFTREMAQKIKEMQRAYDAAPAGDLKLVAAAKMLEAIHELVPVDFWTKVRAVRNLVMLFNPKTIIRNIGGNVNLWLAEVPADTLAMGLDKMTSLVTGTRTRTGLQLAEKFRGLTAPVRDYRAGYDYAAQRGIAHGLWKEGVGHMLAMARLTSGGVFHEGGIQNGYRHVFSSRVMRGLEDGLSLMLGAPDRAFHQAAFLASLARQQDAELAMTGTRPVSPTPEMFATALLDANTAIFQDDNAVSRTLKALQRTLNLNKWGGDERKFGLGNIIVPFTQVPGSIANRAAGVWSPIGFIRGLYAGRHLLFNRGQFDQRAFTDLLSRGALGTGLGYLGFYLFRLGILSALPEEDPDREAMRRAAGLGQYRINASELFRRMMSGDWSTPADMMAAAQDGDVVVNYDWLQPLAVPLAAGAQIAAQEQGQARALARGKTVSDLAAPLLALGAGLQTLEAQPLVSSFTGFMRTAGQDATAADPVGGLGGALLKAGTQELASGFVPTAVRQIGQLVDNTMRESRATPMLGIAAAVPGLSTQFPPRYDVLGEMQERYQAGTNGLVNVLLNPAFITKVQADPVLREMDALYARTGDPGVILPQSKRSVSINGRTVQLTNEQRSDYARVSGRVATSLLRELLAAPAYATLPDEAKASLAATRISSAGTAAKIILFNHRPASAGTELQRALIHAQALGLTNPAK